MTTAFRLAWQVEAEPRIAIVIPSSNAELAPLPVPAPITSAIVWPPGDRGDIGPPGPGVGDYDPGDLTVYFLNALI